MIGGGVSADLDLYLDRAREELASAVVGSGHRPVAAVKAAELGGDAGMIGVAIIARSAASAR